MSEQLCLSPATGGSGDVTGLPLASPRLAEDSTPFVAATRRCNSSARSPMSATNSLAAACNDARNCAGSPAACSRS